MDFFGIGFPELILIFVIILILVGPDKLPEVAANIGRTVRKLKEVSKELSNEFKEMADDVKDSGKEMEQTLNNKTGLSSNLKEVAKEVGEVKKGINTVLNPRGELTSGIKEMVRDITSVGKDISQVVAGDESVSKAPHHIVNEKQDLTNEVITNQEIAPIEKRDAS